MTTKYLGVALQDGSGTDAFAGGGGTTDGTATIDFGSSPGSNEASVTFASAAIGAGSVARAFIVASDTSTDHTASDHKWAAAFIGLSVEVTAGVGGTIYARSIEKMTGTFTVRWQWN